MNTKEDLTWDFILQNEIATEEELRLVTQMLGYSVETLNKVIHCRTEFHDIEQLYACCQNELYFDDELLNIYNLKNESED